MDTSTIAPRVYVTQRVMRRDTTGELVDKFDLSSASAHGELTSLLSANQYALATVPMVRQLRQQLAEFKDTDYLLAIGDPAVMCAAAMIAGERNGGRVKLLKWDRQSGVYVPIQIDTSGAAT